MAKSKVRTKEVNHGFKGIIKELRKLEFKPIVKIGYPAESKKTNADHAASKSDDIVTVLDVAIWNEFGTIQAPERSFVRAAFDKNKKKYLKLNKKLLSDIYAGKKTVEKSLDILGETILNDIKTFLVNNEVSPSSLSEKTLIDTAQMMNSLTFKRIMRP